MLVNRIVFFVVTLLCFGCATPKLPGNLQAITDNSDKSQVYTFKNGASCLKRADYTRYINTKGSVDIKQLFSASGSYEDKMEKSKELSPKYQELDAAFFDICYEHGEGRMSKERYDELRKAYEKIRQRLLEQGAGIGTEGNSTPYVVYVYASGQRVKTDISNQPFLIRSSSVNVGCEQDGNTSVRYDLPPDSDVTRHTSSWVDISNIKSQSAQSAIDGRVVVATGNLRGLDKQFFNCPGGGHATLELSGDISRRTKTYTSEIVQIGESEVINKPVKFAAPTDENLRISNYRVDVKPRDSQQQLASMQIPVSDVGPTHIQQTLFGTEFKVQYANRIITVAAGNVSPE